jgi:acetylornithine/N-succinyldiaminopimelate aminotransferase
MKLAKRATGRSEFIAMRDAYHGSTQGALSLMSDEYFTGPYRPLLPGIGHLRFNCERYLDNISERTAAVIVEPVQAEAGVIPARAAWLRALREKCSEVGALLVFDEIQTGCGRTGSFFAFEQYGVVPDILLLAKGFGGGMPIGAFVADRKLMAQLSYDPVLGHITTFGGHPVSAAASLATLRQLQSDPSLIGDVPAKSALFQSLLAHHPAVVDFRASGLLMALELADFDRCLRVIRRALDLGLIVDWFLFNNRSVRLAPPLVITEQQIVDSCRLLWVALDEAMD